MPLSDDRRRENSGWQVADLMTGGPSQLLEVRRMKVIRLSLAVAMIVTVCLALCIGAGVTQSAIVNRSLHYHPGDTFVEPVGIDYSAFRRVYFVIVKSSCAGCRASARFHARIAATVARTPEVAGFLVGTSVDKGLEDDARSLGLELRTVNWISRRIQETPMILEIDRGGTVTRVWEGTLN